MGDVFQLKQGKIFSRFVLAQSLPTCIAKGKVEIFAANTNYANLHNLCWYFLFKDVSCHYQSEQGGCPAWT